jgi:hypothetical protein
VGGLEESLVSKSSKKQDRTSVLAFAVVGACVIAAFGFSRQSTVIQWVIPAGLIVTAALYAFWPRRSEAGPASQPGEKA